MTFVLDSEAALRRGLAQVGQADGAGACLANVYKWFGGPAWSSTGPGAGQFATAIQGWNFAVYKHAGDYNPPPGVPVYFGIDTPRTDKNAKAGDVALSIGGGRVVCTDSPTGNTGIMTIAARAAQTRRNYLGWTADFLGYTVSGAVSYVQESTHGAKPAPPIVVVKTIPKDKIMYALPKNTDGKIYLVNLVTQKKKHITDPYHVKLINRYLHNDGSDAMLKAETDIVERTYLRAVK